MSISGDFNQRINPFINSTSTTSLNINSSGSGFGSVTGSTWGDIGLSIFNTGTNFAMMALMSNAHLSSATSEVRESAQSAAFTKLQTTINTYVTADANLDTAKQNMQNALDELSGLETDLNEAQAAKDGGINTAQGKVDNYDKGFEFNEKGQANIEKYNNDLAQYKTDMSDYENCSNKMKQRDQLPLGGVDVSSGSAKVDTEIGSTKLTTPSKKEITLKVDGKALSSIQESDFQMEVEDPNDKNKTIKKTDTAAFELAQGTARGLDAEFNARQERANAWNKLNGEIKTRFSSDIQEKAKSGTPPTDPVNTSGAEVIGKKDGQDVTAADYVAGKVSLENDVAHQKEIGTDKNIETLTQQIAAKKKEINGALAQKLKAAEQAFNTAKAAVDSVQTQVKSNQSSNDLLASAKEAKNSKTSKQGRTGGFLGMFKHKSVQDKNYKTIKNQNAQNNAQFANSYGADSATVAQMLQQAQAQVNAVNIDLPDYKNLT
ncbi:hypothetical protein J6O48_02030 [bacterium]|nr:hypothetical protein [bacterium]